MSATAKKYFYVTTPIYYANGKPHLGNTYTTTLADSLTRFYKFLGYQTFFLTGTDEHGDKVFQAAEAADKTALEFTTEVSDLFKRTWKDLGLNYSRFIRTTEDEHKRVVSSILSSIHEKGDIYFGEYGGNYCVGCERFLTDKELVDGKCPDHQIPPQFVKEQNYFFRMSKYQDRLLKHINDNPDFIRPERYKNEVLAMLREPLEDLCISRPKSRLTWGIELPFDRDYVTYVWFDALINYLTGIGYPDGESFSVLWENCEHLVAKDILKPHAVFWPTMLMAAGIPLYRHLNVHGYWITPTGKMSKSLGNVVNPLVIKDEFGMDVFRYFVFRDMAFGLDGTFGAEALETRYNADLANNLGNLVSRSLAMVHRYRNGKIPACGVLGQLEEALQQHTSSCLEQLISLIDKMEIHRALETVWKLIDETNVYIDRTKPWTIAKAEKDSPADRERLDSSLYILLETIRVIGAALTAFLPETSEKIFKLLGFAEHDIESEQTIGAARSRARLSPGAMVGKVESLFPRTDLAKKNADSSSAALTDSGEKTMDESNMIAFDEFSRIELKVGQILAAEPIAKAEKLLKLSVHLGDIDNPRQIVAGIAKHFTPEDLVGRKIVVVANLKPAKLMGHLSEGMLLAASDDQGNLELISPGAAMPPGARVR